MRLDPNPRIPADGQPLNRRLSELFRAINATVNQLSENKAEARYQARDAIPTTGTYAVGDYVDNSAPTKLGTAGSRYVIYGWKRLTAGNSHVLGTDWVQDRRLTGD
jgi:hypothetical protein